MKYKVGDKVVLRSDLEVGERYGCQKYVSNMVKYRGLEAVVERKHGTFYMISVDNKRFAWTDEMFETIPQPHKSLLKSGMKVVYRSGVEKYVFLPAGVFMDENGTTGNSLSYYSDDMLFKSCSFNSHKSQDIMEIYTEDGELIAKREEKSAKDTKIEELEKRMRELADEIAELKGE